MTAAESLNDYNLSDSLEDYLETIFRLVGEKKVARAGDISKRLKVSRSSVTGALRALAERKLIDYAPYELISLTEKGRAAAVEVARRHDVLSGFFSKVLGLDEKEADVAACKFEHAVSDKIIKRFLAFVEFVEHCPHDGARWIRKFNYYCGSNVVSGDCDACEPVVEGVGATGGRGEGPGGAEPAKSAAALTLLDLKRGQQAKVVVLSGGDIRRRRLESLGIRPGKIISRISSQLLGGPVMVLVGGRQCAVGRGVASEIMVETVPADDPAPDAGGRL